MNSIQRPSARGTGRLSTEKLREEQDRQEDEYSFPYHYVAQFGDQFRHHFIDTWAINYVSTMDFLLGKLRNESCSRIVDIGCGDGRFSREMALSSRNLQVLGLDYSPRAVSLAAAMNPDVSNLQFESVDITAETDIGQFDLAVLMEVFEHIPLQGAASFMASVRKLICPGGILYVTVPHANKALEYKHFQHFTVAKLVEYLEPHFDVLEIVPFERISPLRRLMELLLSNRLFILNNSSLLNLIFRWHERYLFACGDERTCQRIFVRARAR